MKYSVTRAIRWEAGIQSFGVHCVLLFRYVLTIFPKSSSAPFRWDDVGSWLALERMRSQDAQGNTVDAVHAGIRTQSCVIAGEEGRLIATIGVTDLIIIQDGDATLVAHRSEEAAIKQLVELLRQQGLEKHL